MYYNFDKSAEDKVNATESVRMINFELLIIFYSMVTFSHFILRLAIQIESLLY